MIEYKLVTAPNTGELEERVAGLIELGYVPLGGVAVVADSRAAIWAQAVVRPVIEDRREGQG